MKLKFYSLLCASVLGASSLMAANTTPSLGSALAPQWANQIDAPINRQDPKGTVASSDGQFAYLLTKYGTHVDGSLKAVFYQYNMETGVRDSITHFEGTPDNDGVESTGEGNFVVNKVDKAGELVWSVNSYLGEPMDYEFCATPDGGVAVLTKVRHSSANADVLFGIKDANGKDFQVPFVQPDVATYGKAYKIVVIKLSADGAIDWLSTADVSWDLSKFDDSRTADPTADYVDVDGIAADPEGNIFITGLHRNEIDFGNGVKAPFPANVKGWSGDVQDKTGDLFVVKYDTKGVAQWIFRSEQKDGKTAQCVNPDAMVYGNGCLFIEGYIQSPSGNSVFLGDKEIQPGNRKALYWFALDAATGTKALYANCFQVSEVKGDQMKPAGMAKFGENLYLCGQFQGSVMYNGVEIMKNTTKKLKPYIIQLNAKTGEYDTAMYWTKGMIVDARSVFEMENKVWCFGYDLMGFTSVYEMDKDFSTVVEHPVTKKQANFDSALSACMLDNRMVGAIAGGRNSDIFLEGVDWGIKADTRTYTAVFASWDIDDTPLAPDSDESWFPVEPDTPTDVEESEANALQVLSANGGLNLVAAEEVQVNIFNLVGVNVYNAVVENGNTFVSLPKGIYIVNGIKTVVF